MVCSEPNLIQAQCFLSTNTVSPPQLFTKYSLRSMSSVSVFRAKLLSPEIMDEVISAGKKSSRDVLNTQDRGWAL